MKLKGKKALVTGASRSIGKAIALAFAKEGADVVISYCSDEHQAQKVVHEIQQLGRKARALQANFFNIDAPQTFFDQAIDFLGSVDLLVNNAASYDTSDLLNLKVEKFNELFQVGVRAPMQLIQLASKQMIQNKIHGSMINISSISGVRATANRVAHSTAKAALNQLTQNCALELGKYHIRVNAIAPGSTPYNNSNEGFVTEGIPLIRTGTPEDQAQAAVFLASEDSSWMTGQIMVIDGGHSLSFLA